MIFWKKKSKFWKFHTKFCSGDEERGRKGKRDFEGLGAMRGKGKLGEYSGKMRGRGLKGKLRVTKKRNG